MDLDVGCPRCGHPFWVRTVEVVVGNTVVCPCCRVKVHLVDADGSVHNAGEEIQQATKELDQTLRNLFS